MSDGKLVLVVGPSGAGKDSIIDAARRRLAGQGRFRFARRVITRPATAGGEDHEALSEDEFARQERAGAFALTWRAHGLRYGLRKSVEEDLAAGCCVVVNVSRAVIADIRRRFPDAVVAWIAAPTATLRQRLLARGRETPAQIERRLLRAARFPPSGAAVRVIVNDGPLETAVAAFEGLLTECRGAYRDAAPPAAAQ